MNAQDMSEQAATAAHGHGHDRNTPRAPLLAQVSARLADTMEADVAAQRLAKILVPALAD